MSYVIIRRWKKKLDSSIQSVEKCSKINQWWPGGCEFQTRLRGTCFPAYFRLSPVLTHVRKVVGDFEKEVFISTSVTQPGNTCASPTAMIWPFVFKWR